jgi:hypothetical protein
LPVARIVQLLAAMRTVSVETRKRMAAAQQPRWEAAGSAKTISGSARRGLPPSRPKRRYRPNRIHVKQYAR